MKFHIFWDVCSYNFELKVQSPHRGITASLKNHSAANSQVTYEYLVYSCWWKG